MPERRHTRLSRTNVELDSPLIDCRLVDLTTAGLGFETSVGLRLGVPYPFRLRDGMQTLVIEAVVRWSRLVRNEIVEGESRPVYRAGASIVDWQTLELEAPDASLEDQIDSALDRWIEHNRKSGREQTAERRIVHRAPPRER